MRSPRQTRRAPSPRWGEVWGEGVRAYRYAITPHPTRCARRPLPMGEVKAAASGDSILSNNALKNPIRRQHAAGAPAPDIILPQLVDVARAVEVVGEALEFARGERHDRAEARGIMHRLRVLHKMDAVDQRRRHALRHHHLAMRADQQAVMLAQRARQSAAFLGVADVTGIGMHGNADPPAHRVVLHRLELDALRQRERRGQIVMEMRDRVHIGARAKNLAVQIDFRRRLHAGRTFNNLAVEIADQQIAGRDRRPALLERLDEQRLASGQPGADMTAVAQNAEIVEQQCRGGDLKPERLFAALHKAASRGAKGASVWLAAASNSMSGHAMARARRLLLAPTHWRSGA